MSEAAKALVAALAKIDKVTKGSTAKMGAYSYTYADLGSVIATCRPALAEHGLVAVQSVTGEAGSISVATWLIHTSGDRLEFGPLTMRAGGTPQEVGSSITYARRYSLLAALGLAAEDDDGHAASQAKPEPRRQYGDSHVMGNDPSSKPPSRTFATREEALAAQKKLT